MPSRDNAIVVCVTCGWKVGDASRARFSEEAKELEESFLRANVVRAYRHYQLGHRLTGKREFRGIIEDEALKIYERERSEAP